MIENKVLVVIPTYNASEFIQRSINSCIEQSVSPEIWIVDNQSDDDTCDIVRKYCEKYNNIKLFINEINLGRIGNWNRCLDLFEESEYVWLKFLFMGDELLPNCIEFINKVDQKYNELVAISWPYLFKAENGEEGLTPQVYGESRIFSKEDLVAVGLFPSEFLGAIVAVALSKRGITGNRFDDFFVGIASFYDRLVLNGNSYYDIKPYSRFNVDSHKTFKRSLNYDVSFEFAFIKSYALERNKEWINSKYYIAAKHRLLKTLLIELYNYYDKSFLLKLYFREIIRILKSKLRILKRFSR